MKISVNGYKRDSLDNERSSLMINSNTLTMQGVDRPITAIPIINGQPDYSQKVILNPGDADYTNPNASGFIEIPNAQQGLNFFRNVYDNYQTSPLTTDNSLFSQINPRFNPNQLGNLPTLGANTAPQTISGYNGNEYTQTQFGTWQDQTGNYVRPTTVIGQDENGVFTQGQEFDNTASNIVTQQAPQVNNIIELNAFNRARGLDESLVTAGNAFGTNYDNINASPETKRFARRANLVRGVSAVGNALLQGAGSFMQGMGQANLNQEAVQKYQEDMLKNLKTQRVVNTYQKGGQVKDEMLLTDGYTSGIPEGSPQQPNAELEGGEFTINPQTGQTMQVLGKKHSQGGEMMDLENNTKVVSDFIKIGSELSRTLKKDYSLSVTPKTTFAKAVEKYRNAIGLTKVLEEQTKVIGKIKDQEEVENQNVRDLNLGHLSEKYNGLEQEKTPLDEKMTLFTEMMFDLQEQNKADEDRVNATNKLKKGGVLKVMQEGGTLDDSQITSLINAFCDITGNDPIEVENMYNQLTEEEKLDAQQSMLLAVQEPTTQENVAQDVVMQEGGEMNSPEQIIQAYAQINNVNPNEVIQQLNSLSQEEQSLALQEMTQFLQQQQGDSISQTDTQLQELFQSFASINNIPVQQVIEEFQAVPDEQKEQAIQVMLDATAQEQQPMGESPNEEVMQEGGVFNNSTDFLEFLKSYTNSPNYTYGSLDEQRSRITQWANELGVDVGETPLLTQADMDSFAGNLQRIQMEENPELVAHYTSNKPFTKADIDQAISSKLVNRKWFSDRGVKFGKDGKALRGTLESGMTTDEALKISSEFGEVLNKEGNEEKKSEFTAKFNDNKWYYRYPEVKTVGFESQEEANNFTKNYSDVGNGVYYSNNTGMYFKPEIGNSTVASTDATPTTVLNVPDARNRVGFGRGYFDQSVTPPQGLFFGSLQRVESPNLRAVNVSYAPQVTEANRQAMTAFESASMLPDSQRRAVEANIIGQTQTANNQSIAQTQAQNEAINSQIERYNDVAIGETDRLNTQSAINYEDRFLRTLAAQEAQQLGWEDYNRRVAGQNMRDDETRRLFNAMSTHYNLTSDNSIVRDANDRLNLNSFILNPPVVKREETTKKTTKKQDGGYIRGFLENLYKKK